MMMCKRAQKRNAPGNCLPSSPRPVTPTGPLTRSVPAPNRSATALSSATTAASAATTRPFGLLLQYPRHRGHNQRFPRFSSSRPTRVGALVVVATDLLALTLADAPRRMGRPTSPSAAHSASGVPMGYGGPHAAFMATRDTLKRQMPGRLVGVSQDAQGNPALRSPSKRASSTSAATRQPAISAPHRVLLAIMASMYAVYHGPEGLTRIARRLQLLTAILAAALRKTGYRLSQLDEDLPLRHAQNRERPVQPGGPCSRPRHARRINLRLYQDGGRRRLGSMRKQPLPSCARCSKFFGAHEPPPPAPANP